jgi:nitroreductase
MMIEEAIQSRASVKVFAPDPVDPAIIQRCLEAAVWAPNHHMTEPWRFTVIAGDGPRAAIAGAVQEEMMQRAHGTDIALMQAKAVKERQKLYSAPVIVAVYSVKGKDDHETRENFAATAAACQNILLMAHSFGLGSIWRTSAIYDFPQVRQILQVDEHALFVASVFLGYSAQRLVKRRRTEASTLTTWLTHSV